MTIKKIKRLLGLLLIILSSIIIGMNFGNIYPEKHSLDYYWLDIAKGVCTMIIGIIIISGKPLIKED